MSYRNMKDQKMPEMIILHHSSDEDDTVKSVVEYHRGKWSDVGYNYLIENGKRFFGRPVRFIGAHSTGENDGSVGVCMVGNYMQRLPASTDLKELYKLLAELCYSYDLPVSKILGHREVGNTDCPGDKLFDFIPEIRRNVSIELERLFKISTPKGD